MRQQPREKDHTGAIIIAVIATSIAAVVFGVALEVLKFVALVKWIFT
jgi:hypothetical protein